MSGRPILTAAETRAAEAAAAVAGTSGAELMKRAGAAVAETVWRVSGRAPVLILCGPGNNGGDGYVAARMLAERGVDVRVAALAEPRTIIARAARLRWKGPTEPLAGAPPAPVIVDALFGTGLARPLNRILSETLARFVGEARHGFAVDLPSGIDSDTGALLSPVPAFDVTIALGALKPAHRLQPAAARCGAIVVADIGLETKAGLVEIARPSFAAPPPEAHKYSRGMVLVAGGELAGAGALAATAALRAGAGSVTLAAERRGDGPMALIRREAGDAAALGRLAEDERIGALLIGPGLGKSEEARARLDAALGAGRPLVLDADALTLIGERGVDALGEAAGGMAILTPHEGEFERLFGKLEGSKVERAREAAGRAGAVVILKGNDTIVAHPDGRAAIAAPAPPWLASAGTGDVLAGIVAALRAQGREPFEASCTAVWLHTEAARRAGPALIADDLLDHLPAAFAACA